MVALTIGMATFNDFDGVYFTLQALRWFHDLTDTELLVVDNCGCEHTKQLVENWVRGRYVLAVEATGTAAPRDRVFAEAQGEAVLCCDSHVLFAPGVIAKLKAYYTAHPDCRDLLQGPLVYDDLQTISTHFDPVWRDQMWGIWATDARGLDPAGAPFDIPMQGLGVFSCRKEAWPGFHPAFRGFGGEEGYLHEKVRQRGGRTLCLPWLRWGHRFGRPRGVPYPLSVEDKLRNYLIGHAELGLDLAPILDHFAGQLPGDRVAAVAEEALRDGISSPNHPITDKKSALVNAASTAAAVDAQLPLVSCICPTYGRCPEHQHLLEEAIESFLRQTYPNKELIVLNDCPGQQLACDAPGIRVINVSERFPTLGEKYNAAIAVARGDLIAPWEDDDISLPWRLSLSVEHLGDAGYFNPRRYWFLDGSGLNSEHPMGFGHNLSLFTRAAFEAVGGYPAMSGAQDAAMDAALRSRVAWVGEGTSETEGLARDKWYYIYRWGVSPDHLSGHSLPDQFYHEIGARPVQQGRFVLYPHWRRNYEVETRQLLAATSAPPSYEETAGTDQLPAVESQIAPEASGCDSVQPSTSVVLFVVGRITEPHANGSLRDFSLIQRREGESDEAHLGRVSHSVDEAIAAGGTHLLVPTEAAEWLTDNAHLVDFFAERHQLVEASFATGIVFALRG